MAERMIIEPVKRIAENYLETRNKVIENCWCMIVGNDTPKQEDGWLEIMNGRQTENGIANIYNFMYKREKSADAGRSTRVRGKQVFYQQRGIYTGRLHESGAK